MARKEKRKPKPRTKAKRPGKTKRQIAAEAAERAKRRGEAYRLKLAGWSYQRIGDHFGISGKTAWEDVDRMSKELTADARDTADKARQFELDSLADVESAALVQYRSAHQSAFETFRVVGPDGDIVERSFLTSLEAVNVARKAAQTIMDCKHHRAKLMGLEAPQRITVEVSQVTRIVVNFATIAIGIVDRFVPRELRSKVAAEFEQAVEDQSRGLKSAGHG